MILFRRLANLNRVTFTISIFTTTLFFPAYAGDELSGLKGLETKGAKVSVFAVRLDDGKVLSSHHADVRLTPASVSKVVLAAAALEKWGSDHTFGSTFYTTGSKRNGVLEGDLVFAGSGDPFLTNEKLWFLTTDVARVGIQEVTGNLVVNTSLFAPMEADGNRKAGRLKSSHAYDSPLSAAAVNFSVMAAVAASGGACRRACGACFGTLPTQFCPVVGFCSDGGARKIRAAYSEPRKSGRD